MLKLLLLLVFFAPGSFSQDDLDQAIEETTESLANMGGMNAEGETVPARQDQASQAQVLEDTPKEPVEIKESFFSGVMNNTAKQFIGQFLAENPFSKVPKKELKTLLLARLSGQPLGNALENNPKFLDMSVDIIRDKRALPNLMGLVNKPEKIKMYGYIVIGVFGMVFILNLMNSKGNIFKRILKKMTIGLIAFTANIGAAFFIFKDELSPTLDIIFKYYHF
ncbi:MAG: hypothetical protein WD025_01285 [Bacteriovoracaceae bacterium]